MPLLTIMKTDRIFVLLLVVMLPMSGCFDDAVGDAEGTDDSTSGTTVINNYYNQSSNQDPVFHIAGISIDEYDVGRISTYDSNSGEELTRMYHATIGFWFSVTDVDSNITSVGFDLNLDNIIDHELTNNGSWSDFAYFETPGIAQSNGTISWRNYCTARFNLIALDDAGGRALVPYALSIEQSVPHQTQGCLEDYTGVEE
jgi:hypothetical protein